jgi:dihydrofolate reductase
MCCWEEAPASSSSTWPPGLVDEFWLHLVPVLLGDGERLLDNVGNLKVQQVRAIEAPGVTHIKYRVVKDRTGRPA